MAVFQQANKIYSQGQSIATNKIKIFLVTHHHCKNALEVVTQKQVGLSSNSTETSKLDI